MTASTSGASQPASFGLVNTPGAPVRVIRVSGPGATATVATSFAEPLIVLVTDAYDNPVSGATVTFAAPSTGAGATFGGSATMTATTDGSGLAGGPRSRPTRWAGRLRDHRDERERDGTQFNLTNTLGAPRPDRRRPLPRVPPRRERTGGRAVRIASMGGTPQSTVVATAFAEPLVVLVTDAYDNPVPGATVTFAAPSTGAGALFGGATITDAAGLVTVTATANTAAGSYSVTASVAGVTTPAAFVLTNTHDAPAQVSAIGGTPQAAVVNTAFAQPLRVRVSDQYGNPVPGATVAFVTPGSGPGAASAVRASRRMRRGKPR